MPGIYLSEAERAKFKGYRPEEKIRILSFYLLGDQDGRRCTMKAIGSSTLMHRGDDERTVSVLTRGYGFSDEDKTGHFCRRYGPGGKFEQEHGFCADARDIADYVARWPHGTLGSCDHREFERFVCERHAPKQPRASAPPQAAARSGGGFDLGFLTPLLGSVGGIVLLVIAGAVAVFLLYSLWNAIKPYLVSGIVMCFLAYMFAATNKTAGIVYTLISLAILNNLVGSGEMEPICGVFFFICTVVTTAVCIKNRH